MTPIKRPIDEQLRQNFKNLNVYYMYPNLITQNKQLISSRRKIDGDKNNMTSKFWKKNHNNVEIVN